MDETIHSPSTDVPAGDKVLTAGSDSEAVAAVLAAHERFFATQDEKIASLAAIVRGGIAHHDAALLRMQDALSETPEHFWRPVADYVAGVRAAVIEPLCSELAQLDLVAASAEAWKDVLTPISAPLARLAIKDQQALSPLLSMWQTMAAGVARLETGISEWARVTLDAASTLDAADIATAPAAVPPETAETDAAAGALQLAVGPGACCDAGAQLTEHLTVALRTFENLTETAKQTLREAAMPRAAQLDAAFSEDGVPAAPGEYQKDPADDLAALWQNWYAQVNARMALAVARLSAFEALVNMQVTFVGGLSQKGPGAWLIAAQKASESLREFRLVAQAIYLQLDEAQEGRQAVRQATDLFKQATARFYRDYTGTIDADEAGRLVDESSNVAFSHIRQQAEGLPESFSVHALPTNSTNDIDPSVPVRQVMLRPAALNAIDATLAPALTAASEVVRACAAEMSEEAGNLQAVLRFHLGAAVEELRDAYWAHSSAEARRKAGLAAHEVSIAGIDRVLEALVQQQRMGAKCLAEVSGIVTNARAVIWQTVGSQVQAETAAQKLSLKTRAGFSASALALRRRMSQAAEVFAREIWRLTRFAYQKVRIVLRYGRSAVIGDTTRVDRDAMLDAVAKLGDIRSGLPVVYRRLFSFYPLGDETLLAGREEDLVWLRRQLGLRRRGRTHAYVLTSTPGCGQTTLLNAARQTCLRGANVREIDITRRVTEESVLVGLMMDAMVLEYDGDRPTTLTALANMIMTGEEPSTLTVCIVEHLEYLFLRRIGGMDLFGRVLRFFSETDSHVLWIATASDFAWQLLAKNEPLALGLVRHYRLGEYNRASVEDVIVKRHRRSGLPMVFEPPAVISPFLGRRLKKAETEAARQVLLQGQYFDDLFSASGQNVTLALFYWQLSIDYLYEPASIRVRPLPRLDFEFLNSLSLPETFAMKAFLEHASLTVDEYSVIANVEVAACLEVFESLGNSMIVEQVSDETRNLAEVDFERIEQHLRYRIRPLLVQPVIRYLRARNIVH